MKSAKVWCAILAVSAALGAQAAVLEVGPGKTYSDIATAIGAANDHDTVLVYDGTYEVTEQLEITKPITVKSVNGPAVTTVGNTMKTQVAEGKAYRVFLIDDPDAVVEGFTISGGYAYKKDGSPLSTTAGAGVRIDANGGTLSGCIVTGNEANRVTCGGGVAIVGAAGVVTNCVIRGNAAPGWQCCGGGVWMTNGLLCDSVVSNNTIGATSKTAINSGAGVYASGGRVSHCSIIANVIHQNAMDETTHGGAGICCAGTVDVDNCLIARNTASTYGGGLKCSSATVTPRFTNCTFTANSSTRGVGGAECGKATFYGCIFADNVSPVSKADAGWPEIVPASATFKYCLSTKTLPAGNGNVSDKPANLGPDGVTPDFSSAAVDLCPTGDYAGLADGLDILGNPRLSGEKVDAGCAEYQYPDVVLAIVPPVRRSVVGTEESFTAKASVKGATTLAYKWTADDGTATDWVSDPNVALTFLLAGHRRLTLTVRADGVEKGSVTIDHDVAVKDVYVVPYAADHVPAFPYADLETAATNIAEALLAAADGSTVHVADGTYSVTEAIILRDYAVTVASLNGPGTTRVRNTVTTRDASTHRVFLIDNAQSRVEGLAISGGYGFKNDEGALDAMAGTGVRIDANGGTLANCIVTNCQAFKVCNGGGVALLSDLAVVTNCVFERNFANQWKSCGGGAYVSAGLITHSVFRNNAAGISDTGDGNRGGGVYATGGRISHCTFEGNYIDRKEIDLYTEDGGGALNCAGAVVVDNCLFTGNGCVKRGGAVLCSAASTLLNCTILDNSAAKLGGGVYCTAATPVFRNCLIQGNVMTGTDTSATTNFSGTAASYTRCSSPEVLPAGEGNVQATVELNSRFVPKRDSAAVDKGSVDGYEQYLVGGTDLLGKRRIVCGIVDIGCCENQQNGLMLMVR